MYPGWFHFYLRNQNNCNDPHGRRFFIYTPTNNVRELFLDLANLKNNKGIIDERYDNETKNMAYDNDCIAEKSGITDWAEGKCEWKVELPILVVFLFVHLLKVTNPSSKNYL